MRLLVLTWIAAVLLLLLLLLQQNPVLCGPDAAACGQQRLLGVRVVYEPHVFGPHSGAVRRHCHK
jgi:hypothetical protein